MYIYIFINAFSFSGAHKTRSSYNVQCTRTITTVKYGGLSRDLHVFLSCFCLLQVLGHELGLGRCGWALGLSASQVKVYRLDVEVPTIHY